MNRFHHASAVTLCTIAIFMTGCRQPSSTTLPPSNVNADEELLFFPTYGSYAPEVNTWRFDVHGIAFEPEYSSAKRKALIKFLMSTADLDGETEDAEFMEERIRPFLVDNERRKSVTIMIAKKLFAAGTSEGNGHFSNSLTVNAESLGTAGNTNEVVTFEAVLPEEDARTFAGRVHLIASRGISVVSDIDDTIKQSEVTNKSELLRNTFLREFQPVAGMPELYSRLAESDVAFHYVSGSPWQLYQPLEAFLLDAGYPQGTFHLKHFRMKDSSALELFLSQQGTKLAAIRPLLKAFPDRDFILIGDSGEQDPEIYGQLARESADQIAGIFIRNVTGQRSEDERFATAFHNVPRDRWTLFDDVSEVTDQIVDLSNDKP